MSEPLRSIAEFRALDRRVVAGLMSGTSVDGVDAALVELSGTGERLELVQVLATEETPYSEDERRGIHALFDGNVADICEMNVVIGERLASAALAVIEKAGLRPGDVHAIGSHGQTIYHIPPGGERAASTLQIGEPAVIAERTGITTVADFRPRDMAAGGNGAPLVPYVDWTLCRRDGEVLALQNIGGIANLTLVTPDLRGVRAFDTGPGNMTIDAAATLATAGYQSYDRDGRLALSAEADQDIVRELLGDEYFRRPPPKSTGREHWGVQYVERVVARTGLSGDRLVSTMTELTARSIADAYERFVLPTVTPSGIYLSGGGTRNPALVARIAELLAPVSVRSSDALGLPSDFKEAIAFAVLANETLCGSPSNVPGATGALVPRVLGAICPGS